MHHSLILVVDDDPGIRATVTEFLELEGYPVLTARDGAEALHVIEHDPPALVLLDMRMPVMDGWAFAHEVERRGLSLQIVVMTAAQDARRWCDEIHAQDCLPKPFDLPELLKTVERFAA